LSCVVVSKLRTMLKLIWSWYNQIPKPTTAKRNLYILYKYIYYIHTHTFWSE